MKQYCETYFEVTCRRKCKLYVLTSLSLCSFFSVFVVRKVPSLKDEPRCSPRRLTSLGLFLPTPDAESAEEIFWSLGLFLGEAICLRLLVGDNGASSFGSRDLDMEGVRRMIFRLSSSLNELAFFSTPTNK